MKFSRRIVLAGLALVPAAPALAFDRRTFDLAAFEDAQKTGRSIIVHVNAPWCPTCRRQKQILAELETAPAFDTLLLFEVDFDTQPDVLKLLQVERQSTLIAFKGGEETDRAVGVTDAAEIEALMSRAL